MAVHGGRRRSVLHLWSFLSLLLLFRTQVRSFYLPGVSPQDFKSGDPLKVKVNELTSVETQLPYSYYSLPYCRPETIVDSPENIGEVLRGSRIENSLYQFKMREPQICSFVCRLVQDAESANRFKRKIDDAYRVNMILDNLPLVVAWPEERITVDSPTVLYQHGFYVGVRDEDGKYFINNHLRFTVEFHRDPETNSSRVVGFEVEPLSIRHDYEGKWDEKKTPSLLKLTNFPQEIEENREIMFTYDVEFRESYVKWASRWDTYLLTIEDDSIHWFSIMVSLAVVLVLSGFVGMAMLRAVYRDIFRYDETETDKEKAHEEKGWKLVHRDVFRPPENNPDLLCVHVGTGVQVFGMVLVGMIFAALGFLSPANRGGLMTAMLLLWAVMGVFAGYSAARLHRLFKGAEWKRVALKTSLAFPGAVFAIFLVLNAVIWGEQSSGAVPLGKMMGLVGMWFVISVPLVFVGGYVGFTEEPAMEVPVMGTTKEKSPPREIPRQAWYMNPALTAHIGGVLPFSAVFVELLFILTSVWLNQIYYMFSLLLVVFLVLVVTCAEVTIAMCYHQLQEEDYRWWWRSYLNSGSSAMYLFLVGAVHGFTGLGIRKVVTGVVYLGYMLIISYAFFVLTGAIGFYASLFFTRFIYSSLKVD